MSDGDIRAVAIERIARLSYADWKTQHDRGVGYDGEGGAAPEWADAPGDSGPKLAFLTAAGESVDAIGDLLGPGETVVRLLRDLIDPIPCRRDERGVCRAHGQVPAGPDRLCPHDEAKRWLADHRPDGDAGER
ncbi:hypothetical protein [Nocardia aurantia]|uniref:Uncharacterized protein n=1 Tax=Nocardia aurantia TaxID=2585199 RepID=A0A7K0DH31_9NOCA|nr:hypothetical protein [Nocardia aurantia]MQY24582.1 hypothetical protein [Nocardia aurantia]